MLKRPKCLLFQQMFTSWFERNLIKSYFFFPVGLLKMPFFGPKMWDMAKNYQSGNIVERFCTFSLSTCFMEWWKSYVFRILHTKNTHFPRNLSNLKAVFISFCQALGGRVSVFSYQSFEQHFLNGVWIEVKGLWLFPRMFSIKYVKQIIQLWIYKQWDSKKRHIPDIFRSM